MSRGEGKHGDVALLVGRFALAAKLGELLDRDADVAVNKEQWGGRAPPSLLLTQRRQHFVALCDREPVSGALDHVGAFFKGHARARGVTAASEGVRKGDDRTGVFRDLPTFAR